ncbi:MULTISPECIES: BppU family phage baseplate upper protein [Bacillus]|uniref:BppU family phage baseplate upper protein n=1 Tax=Bacillus licheniformis TaxID=1402 RepID=UPI000D9DB643|nr:BppU family phage baseplate upper protein [Bacillus licheniformis]MEC2364854.1 BppU family phage baseplate upper protein [Bacillus licheniformis]MEC3538322.1 BppU family phage baseplate upper protein [Bacillus licheniformis]MED0696385.1 BppU family phage baseplate upper protein [Bacillus licheniformis]MED0792624.1 BppU family phage baseplate upper protein [Bacillus licheniformis]MED0821336.1 BppU family phage baseplate upper protein [Bacillus licheniformis]
MAIYKTGSYAFDINAKTEGVYHSTFIFSTQDINTAKLIFYLRKDGIPLPLSAVTGKVVLIPSSGKQRIRDVTIVDPFEGIAEYVLDEDEIKMYGKFNCQLILKYTNGQSLSAHKFGFEVSQSLVDQNMAPLAEYYVDDFESLKALIIAMYDEETVMLDELKAKFSDLGRIETKEGAQEKADAAEAHAKAYTDAHAAKTNNPHKVTKAQVGLSNVDNVKQASKTEFDSHVNDTSNPHDVTKAQIGLSNVDDVQQASKKEFDAHDDDTTRHITADERIAWNAKETTTGAQEKADKALSDAKTYVSNFSWVVATLQNGWAHYNGGEDVVFGIDATKTVWVRGAAKGGVTGTTVFTLPENMRPIRDMGCIQIASGTAQVARLLFRATGEVVVENVSSNTNYIRFDFSFKAL